MGKYGAQDKCMKCRYYCKKFIAFLFSHVGLCGLVVAYVILGAITFKYLEVDEENNVRRMAQFLHRNTTNSLWNITHSNGPIVGNASTGDLYYEREKPFLETNVFDIASMKVAKRKELEQARANATKDLWNITMEMNVLYEKNWTYLVDERILRYHDQLMDVLQNESAEFNSSMMGGGHIAVEQPPEFNDTNRELEQKQKLLAVLLEYEKEVLKLVRQRGYDGDYDDSDKANKQWSIPGGLLYSLTVITTIGYGHITPKTDWGKIVTMIYAIIGIPLMLLCLANIGDALAHSFKFFYWKICCLYCEVKKRRQRLMRIQSVRMSNKSHRSSANTMLSNNVGPNSMHASFKIRPPSTVTIKSQDQPIRPPNTLNTALITISDDGSPTPSPTHEDLNKQLPESPNNSGATTERATTSNDPSSDVPANTNGTPHETIINFSIEGADPPANLKKLPPMAMDDEYADGEADEKLMMTIMVPSGGDKRKMSVCNMPPETIDGIDYVDETPQHSPTHLSPDENTAVIVHDVRDQEESYMGDRESRRYDQQKQSVPVYVCLLVVLGYIIGGSILFKFWEKWGFLESFYFCFITLTTIGFGDFVPGVSASGTNTENSESKLSLTSLYLVFGMALLAMSFNLVQEAATEKAKWIGRRLGILVESDEDDDD